MADTIVGAHNGSFKDSGVIGMSEIRDFLVNRDGVSAENYSADNLPGSISMQKLYNVSQQNEIELAAAYASSNYNLGGFYGSNYTNNTPPVISLLGPNYLFGDNTERILSHDSFSSSLTIDTEGRIYALRAWVRTYGESTSSSRITAFGGPNQESATQGTNNEGSPWGLTTTIGTQGRQKSFYHHLDNNSDTITTNGRAVCQSGGYSRNTAELTGILVPPGWRIDVIRSAYYGGGTAYSKTGPAYFYDYISSTNHYMNRITYDYNLQQGNWYQYMTLLDQQPIGTYLWNGSWHGSIRQWIGNSHSDGEEGYTFKLTRVPMPTF